MHDLSLAEFRHEVVSHPDFASFRRLVEDLMTDERTARREALPVDCASRRAAK